MRDWRQGTVISKSKINTVLQGDCLELMKDIPDGSVDMVITSPPYDNLRSYKGSLDWGEHIWKPVLEDLYRVVKDGGVVVWVVGDATIKGSETGTSFRQALYAKEIGFNLHDTMIWGKPHPIPRSHPRYEQAFEYMFIFSKSRPVFNPIKTEAKLAGKRITRAIQKTNDGVLTRNSNICSNLKVISNLWMIAPETIGSHPAMFPLKLAQDHVKTWSNENDTVLDPFAGSGTTAIAALNTNRNYILMEKEPEYIEIIKQRLAGHDVTPIW